jgi:hypothetical protein
MMRKSTWFKPVAGGLLGVMLVSCGATVDWRYYAPFRVIGQERAVSPVDPAEIHYAGVAPKLHYVSITLDSVFFRNLPGTVGREVALGVELSGALPGDVKVVSEPVAAKGPNGFIFIERPFAIDPFLYRGVPLRLTLTFRDIGPAESKNLKGRLAALGLLAGAARKIVPDAVDKIKVFSEQFESFMGKAHKDKLFTYTFSLYPSDMEGVRQDLVVTGGRHVFIGIPATDSPKFIKKVKPADLVYKLRLAGRRLEWRHDNTEYTESPYIMLSVIRYKRYPAEETALRQAVKKVDRFIEEGNWKLARSGLANIGTALLEDKTITQMEKNLEQAWKDVRAAKIDAGEAAAQGDKEALLQAYMKQLKLFGYIAKDFQQILEPAEVKDLQFQARRVTRLATDVSAEIGKPPTEVAALSKATLESIKPPPEPPANPLTGLKPPEVVTITITKPEPFYKKWWFYTLVGVAAAGFLSGGTYAATRTEGPPQGPRVLFNGKPQGP